ncbi:MAG: competence/damage-inducible protein A [Comamonas sp.]
MSYRFSVLIIGDEILSGKRQDGHLAKAIEILAERGLQLAGAEYAGDDLPGIAARLERLFASGDQVFSFGGIGATPDDHTRQAAALALGQPLALHPQAAERMQDMARDKGEAFDPERADNRQRLQMGVFPERAQIIENPYNKIPGFSCAGVTVNGVGGWIHFLPGFPVMAWPMMAAVLDARYRDAFHRQAVTERSVKVYGAMESALTPWMVELEAQFPAVKVFSLPSVGHAGEEAHIELGVKGSPEAVAQAWPVLQGKLHQNGARMSAEMVREIR